MDEYQRIKDGENPSAVSVKTMNIESFMLDKYEEVRPFVKKFKRWSWALILIAGVMPLCAWFVDENHVLFIQSWGFFAAEILVGLIGLRCLRYNTYKRLESLKKFIHVYFLALLAALGANMSFFTYAVVKHNEDNCGDFDFYRVCKDRWGVMGAQLTLIIFYPLILFVVLIIYRYYLQTTKELMNALLRREL